jgi:hypothetical protein
MSGRVTEGAATMVFNGIKQGRHGHVWYHNFFQETANGAWGNASSTSKDGTARRGKGDGTWNAKGGSSGGVKGSAAS